MLSLICQIATKKNYIICVEGHSISLLFIVIYLLIIPIISLVFLIWAELVWNFCDDKEMI